jgi:hypothetical protein
VQRKEAAAASWHDLIRQRMRGSRTKDGEVYSDSRTTVAFVHRSKTIVPVLVGYRLKRSEGTRAFDSVRSSLTLF